MKVKIALLVFLQLCLSIIAAASVADNKPLDLKYYLPKDAIYDTKISTPKSVLGFEVGEYHARHDQVIDYMYRLAEQSTKVSVIEIGRTWDQRPQILVVITTEENQIQLDKIIEQRSQLPGNNKQKSALIVWLGYSIHGNEASGTNASLLSAYHLAANTADQHEQFLKDTVILIEPSMNPDGYGRFSNWANNNRSTHLSSDPMDREHQEDWPNGRSNHYRFDLNRDWLPAQQPESKARLTWFYRFRPHVLGDYHEMGSNSSYFFQPGVPARQNPLTPEENFEITDTIARYHAKTLDQAGSLYFSKQRFDDFYYGKGSTYPDINGGIGILFEQASSRGHLQDTINGSLSFPFAIKNHFLTSLSILEGAYAQIDRLIDYQQSFYDKAITAARNDNTRAVVVSDDGDSARALAFIDILLRHKIKVFKLADQLTVNKTTIKNGFIVPFNQAQYRLIKSLFETRTSFNDNTFYDVSSWTLPHAFNLPFESIDRKHWNNNLLGTEIISSTPRSGTVAGKAKVAYVFDWNNYAAPAALNQLLTKKLKVRVAGKSFITEKASGNRTFSQGSIVIPVGIQSLSAEELYQQMLTIAAESNIQIETIDSGYSVSGIDIGSGDMEALKKPTPLMLTGPGLSEYDTGEVWNLLDQHLKMPLTQAKIADFSRLKLNTYSHLIMADGNYDVLNKNQIESIEDWIKNGGVLIAMKSAAKWVADNKLIEVNFYKPDEEKQSAKEAKAYSNIDNDEAQNIIGGSIFATEVDITHPLAFGYQRDFLPVFRNHTLIMNASANPYATIVRYRNEPLLGGFVSNENLEKIANSAMMVAERKGKGSVILILDNPVFRGFWYGSSRLFINSLFFGRAFRQPAKT